MDNLAEMSLIELKALAYDTLAGMEEMQRQIQTGQQTLQAINQEIVKKNKEAEMRLRELAVDTDRKLNGSSTPIGAGRRKS